MGLGLLLKPGRLRNSLSSLLRGIRKRATLRMVADLPSIDDSRPLELPAGFRLAPYASGQEESWIALLNASEEFGTWDHARLEQEILATLIPGGGIFAILEENLVGCAAVCCQTEYEPQALLMYVTVLPEHRRRKLGLGLVREALAVCKRQQFPGLVLHTNNKRLAAIRTYLKLGFKPQVGPGVAGKRQWSDVLGRAFLQERH